MELIDVLPDDVQPGDYMCINDELTKIVAVYPKGIVVDIGGKKLFVQNAWSRAGVRYKREVDERPHGLIPDEYGAVIHINGHLYAAKTGDDWQDVFFAGNLSHDEVQGLADRFGFEVLWPEPEVKITDEMVERAGREVWKVIVHRYGKEADDEWTQKSPGTRDYHKAQARRILEVALEGE